MKYLITAIVQALVDQPDAVQVDEIIGSHTIVLEENATKRRNSAPRKKAIILLV